MTRAGVLVATLAFALVSGACGSPPPGGTDGDVEEKDPPLCSPEDEESAPPSDDVIPEDPVDAWIGITQFLTTCDNLFGVGTACAQPATGTIRLGEETWTMAWGCAGPLTVDDGWGEGVDSIGATHDGFHLSLAPADGCAPELNITVLLAPEDLGLESLELPLGDPLCPEGEAFADNMRRVALTLGTETSCFQPPENPTGSLDLTLVPNGTTNGAAGSLLTTVMDESGTAVELEVTFEIERTFTLSGFHFLTRGMCKAR